MFYKGDKQRDREHCGNARQASIKHNIEEVRMRFIQQFLIIMSYYKLQKSMRRGMNKSCIHQVAYLNLVQGNNVIVIIRESKLKL